MSTRPACDIESAEVDGELHGLSLAKLTLNVAADMPPDSDDEAGLIRPAMPSVPIDESDSDDDAAADLLPAAPQAAGSGSDTEWEGDPNDMPAPFQPQPAQAPTPRQPARPAREADQLTYEEARRRRGKRSIYDDPTPGEKVTFTSDEDEAPAAAPAARPRPAIQPAAMPEPLDPSQPMLNDGGWVTKKRGLQAQLARIALRFRNPETLQDDDWLMNLNATLPRGELVNGDINEIMKVREQMQLMIRDLINLAIISPLSAELMKPNGDRLRAQMSSIYNRIRDVLQRYKKVQTKPRQHLYPMKDALENLALLKEMVNVFAAINSTLVDRLKNAKKQLTALRSQVLKYVEAEFEREALPEWYTEAVRSKRVTDDIKNRLRDWKLDRTARVVQASIEAERKYQSIVQLQRVVDELQEKVDQNAQKKEKRQKQADGGASSSTDPGPSSSKDPPAAANIVELDSSDEDEAPPAAVPPVPVPTQADLQALAEEARGLAEGPLMYITGNNRYYDAGLRAVVYISNNPSNFEEAAWIALLQALLDARRYGRYAGSGVVAEREFKAIVAIKKLLEKAATMLSLMNADASVWLTEKQHFVPEGVIEAIQTEADRMRVTEASKLQESGYFDPINQAIEAILIIAAGESFREEAWESVANALAILYAESLKPGRPLAVGRLIGFFERSADILKQKDAETAAWVAVNAARFRRPGEAPSPMETGGAAAEDEIEENIEVYTTDFESGSDEE